MNMTGRIGEAEQDRHKRTDRAGLPEQDCEEEMPGKTARIGCPGQ
jgi:hypothetical protein